MAGYTSATQPWTKDVPCKNGLLGCAGTMHRKCFVTLMQSIYNWGYSNWAIIWSHFWFLVPTPPSGHIPTFCRFSGSDHPFWDIALKIGVVQFQVADGLGDVPMFFWLKIFIVAVQHTPMSIILYETFRPSTTIPSDIWIPQKLEHLHSSGEKDVAPSHSSQHPRNGTTKEKSSIPISPMTCHGPMMTNGTSTKNHGGLRKPIGVDAS